MTSDAPASANPTLPARAAIAMLTLQLRAAQQDVAAAEAECAAVDQAAALEQLRAKLDPLMEQRRRALDEALAAARAQASADIKSARVSAAEIVARAQQPVVAPALAPPAPAATAVARTEAATAPPTVPVVAAPPVNEQPIVPLAPPPPPEAPAPSAVAPVAASVLTFPELSVPVVDNPSSAGERPQTPGMSLAQPIRIESTPTTIVIDAEAFARVFATVMATMLDDRFGQFGPGMIGRSGPATQPKPSFWSQARHLDVLLMTLAMLILLTVIAAWLA